MGGVGVEGRQLAAWLVARRREIERRLETCLGTLPPADSPESEALRRFRSFAAAALLRGEEASPALDGLRVSERRTARLLGAWLTAAAETAGPHHGPALRMALEPILLRFNTALRSTGSARRASGAPRRSNRRAVSAAIDRVCDAFLAIDTDSGTIADANPAAGALLGTTRDGLVGASALRFVPEAAREDWWGWLDSVAEGAEPRRFAAHLRDSGGQAVSVEASITRFATRTRTLALVMARPRSAGSARPSG